MAKIEEAERMRYAAAAQRLGCLLFPGEGLIRLTPEQKWILKETTEETDPDIDDLDDLKASAMEHPALTRTHPLISREMIRATLIRKASREYQEERIAAWIERRKIPYTEIKGRGIVHGAQFETAITKFFPRATAVLLSETAAPDEDEVVSKNKGGRPPIWDWKGMIIEVAVRICVKGLPTTQAELVKEMADWFAGAHKKGLFPDEKQIAKHIAPILARIDRELNSSIK